MEWPLGSRQVLDVGSARIARPDQAEDPGPGVLGGGDQRLERVEAEQRIGREGVGAEAGNVAPWSRRRADQRLGVGGSGDRYVAALAVGDRQQAGFAGEVADLCQGGPARRAQPLETGELGLDRDAGGAGKLDQPSAVEGDGVRRQLGGRPLGLGARIRSGEFPRIRVEAKADLAAALIDERREPICERSRCN
jgi:hypothetical protein